MGRVALVTGGSAGIGWATAEKLAASGWTVVAASRRGCAPEGCQGLVMDVDEDASVKEGVEKTIDDNGRVDALVNCAGWGIAGALETTPLADAKAQMETNFWGSVRAVQAVLPTMREQGGGHVILLSSIAGAIGVPYQCFYSASKFALEGLGEALAYEVGPFGIKVTLIEPGNVRTEFTAKRRVLRSIPYAEAQSKAVAKMERDELNGVAPAKVASAIVKVLSSQRPPRRVSVGKVSERIGLVAKRALPFVAFEAAARSSLGV